jgi:hypothetical protein
MLRFFTAITKLALAISELYPKQRNPRPKSLFWLYFRYIIGRIFLRNLLKIKAGGGGGSRTNSRPINSVTY